MLDRDWQYKYRLQLGRKHPLMPINENSWSQWLCWHESRLRSGFYRGVWLIFNCCWVSQVLTFTWLRRNINQGPAPRHHPCSASKGMTLSHQSGCGQSSCWSLDTSFARRLHFIFRSHFLCWCPNKMILQCNDVLHSICLFWMMHLTWWQWSP